MILRATRYFVMGSQYKGWGTPIKEGEVFECENKKQCEAVIRLGFATEVRDKNAD